MGTSSRVKRVLYTLYSMLCSSFSVPALHSTLLALCFTFYTPHPITMCSTLCTVYAPCHVLFTRHSLLCACSALFTVDCMLCDFDCVKQQDNGSGLLLGRLRNEAPHVFRQLRRLSASEVRHFEETTKYRLTPASRLLVSYRERRPKSVRRKSRF